MSKAVLKTGLVMASTTLLVVVALAGIAAPIIAPHDPAEANLPERLLPPAWIQGGNTAYLLGTDLLGRDVFSRLVYGTRTMLAVSLIPALVAGIIGATLGLVAGYFSGRTEARDIRLADVPPVWIAILPVPLAFFLVYPAMVLVAMGVPGPLVILAFTAGLPGVVFAHQVRKETLRIKGEDALRRAWEAGASHVGVIIRRILPGVGKYLVVLAPLAMTYAIVLESVMSYLGIGLPRPTPSWGLMVADGRAYQTTGWWLSGFPALAILLVVSGGSLLAMRLGEQLNLR